MKKLITIVLALISIHAFSQTQTDKKADDILKPLIKKYKGFTSTQAEFTYTFDNPAQKTNATQKGAIVSKGNKYKLDINDQEIISDGKIVWTYLKKSQEVQINDVNTKSDAVTPTNVFTMYEKGYVFKFIEEKNEGGKIVQTIDVMPEDKTKKFFKARLRINKADKSLLSSKIFNKDGSHITLTIDKLTPNIAVADDQFTWNKAAHPKVEEVDLR